jgi:hydroxymethylbilane synthase
MLPAPGQGALAIETRAGDSRIEAIASELNHYPTALAVFAERSFLQNMGGGCNVPVGVHGHVEQNMIQIDALVSSTDGQRTVRDSIRLEVDKSREAVAALSQRILSRGGRDILNEMPHAL